jgi:hypothetical protein
LDVAVELAPKESDRQGLRELNYRRVAGEARIVSGNLHPQAVAKDGRIIVPVALRSSVTLAAGQSSSSFTIAPLTGSSGLKTVRIQLQVSPFSLQYLVGQRFQSVVAIAD